MIIWVYFPFGMEPTTSIIISIILAGAMLLPIIGYGYKSIKKYISSYLLSKREVRQPYTRIVDTYLVNHNICKKLSFGDNIPEDGYYYGWIDNHTYSIFCVFRKKTKRFNEPTVKYNIWTRTDDAMEIVRRNIFPIECDQNIVTVHRVSSSTAWECDLISDRVIIPSTPYEFQTHIMTEMYNYYVAHNKSCTSLITGPPRIGKSVIARLFMRYLMDKHIDVMVIEGIDPTQPGQNIDKLIHQNIDSNNVLIILIDEIDIAFEKAESGTSDQQQSTYTCYAQNKSKMNKFLDHMCELPNTFVIYTCNSTICILEKAYSHYVGKGRINMKFSYE